MNKQWFLLLCLFYCYCYAGAQNLVPASGVYYLDKNKNQYFDAAHYTSYLYRVDDFFQVNIKPHSGVYRAGLEYALVAVNPKEQKVRIALLQDTVSRNAKERRKQTGPGSVSYTNGPYYAAEYNIAGDSLAPSYAAPYFPDKIELDGTWAWGREYLGVFTYPETKQVSIPDTLTKTYRNGYIYTFEESFYRRRGNHYINLVYLLGYEHPVPVYARPAPGAKVLTRFADGEVVAVVSDTIPGWYQVDRILVEPDTHPRYGMPAGGSRLKYISGWLRREDLVAGNWVKQKEQSPLFRFEASGHRSDNGAGYTGDAGRVDAIKIIDKKTGKTQQLIADIGASLESDMEHAVKVIDFNFDGYPDLMLYYQNGGAGPNSSWNFYAYNPLRKQFEYNDTLSALSQVAVDTKTKTISAAWRGGAGLHGAERYQYIDGVLTRTYFWEQTFGLGYFASEQTGALINGHWEEQTLQGAELAASSVSIYEQPEEAGTVRIISKAKDDAFLYFLIEAETPLWYKVKYEETLYRHEAAGKNKGTAYRPVFVERTGWMHKEALLPQQWQVQPQQTALFRFETTDSNQLVAVRIVEKANGKARQIVTSNALAETRKDSVLQVYDYNFDGQPDFSFDTRQEGDDAISSYRDYYCYDPAAGLFIKDSLLSTLPNLSFDAGSGTAKSTVTSSRKINKEVKEYRYTQGRWQLIHRQSSDCKALTAPCTVTDGRWIQGKWEQQTSKQNRETIFPE